MATFYQPQIMFRFATPTFLASAVDVVNDYGAETFLKSLHNYSFLRMPKELSQIHVACIPDIMYDDMMTFVNNGESYIMNAYNKLHDVLGDAVDQFVIKEQSIVEERIDQFLRFAADEYFKNDKLMLSYMTLYGKWGQLVRQKTAETYPIVMSQVLYSAAQKNFKIIDQYLGPNMHSITITKRSDDE